MPEKVKIFPSLEAAEKALPENSPKKLILNNAPYCILRKGSHIYVTDDTCPHQRASLSGGWTNPFNEIICPLHEYRYNLDTGRESAQRCEDLQTYKVLVEDEGVFVLI